jgi:hypothetical protein
LLVSSDRGGAMESSEGATAAVIELRLASTKDPKSTVVASSKNNMVILIATLLASFFMLDLQFATSKLYA